MHGHREPRPRAIFTPRARRRGGLVRLALLLLLAAVAGLGVAAASTGGSGAAGGGTADGPLGAADGYVPVGGSVSPFGVSPAVTRLRPRLRAAVRRAAEGARAAGLDLRVNGGWRSRRYQATLLRRAVVTYGSEAEARRWVLPPARSSHVHGAAVDVGPADAALWLEQHGAAYGLCRVYVNELWHFELATTPQRPCPPLRPDAAGG